MVYFLTIILACKTSCRNKDGKSLDRLPFKNISSGLGRIGLIPDCNPDCNPKVGLEPGSQSNLKLRIGAAGCRNFQSNPDCNPVCILRNNPFFKEAIQKKNLHFTVFLSSFKRLLKACQDCL